MECLNVPNEKINTPGVAVVRIELSFPITNSDVDAIVGRDRLADVTIRPANGMSPDVGILRSAQDVDEVRLSIRSVLAAIRTCRPEVELVHLFMAAPSSVCFVTGQELRLRNSFPVQTYRYRKDQSPAYQDAIFLSSSDAPDSTTSLTEEQVGVANRVRSHVWPRALESVQQYAAGRKRDIELKKRTLWYDRLDPANHLAKIKPFPPLPPIYDVIDERDRVDQRPYNGDFGRDKDQNLWRSSDHLLVAISASTQDNEDELEQLIRLFLFHEYLHDYHVLTKYTAAEVGKYANCLERIDYMADLYALLHQLDLTWRKDMSTVKTEAGQQRFLSGQVDLILRSFWAFEPEGFLDRWQVRRVRRYLNWYWRQIQVLRAPNLATALRVLSKPPVVELAGVQHRTDGRRVFMIMNRLDPTTDLGLGLVLENERLLRIASSTTTNLHELMEAFRTRNHEEIKQFFRSVYEEANAQAGAFPQ